MDSTNADERPDPSRAGAAVAAAEPRADDEEVLDRLRLAGAEGLSPRLQRRMIERFGSARGVFAASSEAVASVPGVGAARAALMAAAPTREDARRDLERTLSAGAQVLLPGRPGWPPALAELDDPPTVLFARGELLPQDARAVAIVGSRRASSYGSARARELAAELAGLGFTVVSGLARGVDAAAHRGALDGGGRTLGVLGGGLARFYPKENVPLAREMVARGAVLSEFPLDVPPRPYHFPRRNRIIAVLAVAVVVVEAADGSGSLITADHALDLGREVLAVPGRTDAPNSRGVHRLLREGAALCESAVDVLRALGIEERPSPHAGPAAPPPPPEARNAAERALLEALAADEADADRLLEVTSLPAADGLAALSALELRGAVLLEPDGRYSIARGAVSR